jgi:hypothetical protein
MFGRIFQETLQLQTYGHLPLPPLRGGPAESRTIVVPVHLPDNNRIITT